jgi:hypothetical protein
LQDLHKGFHEQVGDLYVKLVATHVANGHGTIEWLFGGKDIGVFKTGKPFDVPGVSVVEVAMASSPAISITTMWLQS